jgi:hypothetical protein
MTVFALNWQPKTRCSCRSMSTSHSAFWSTIMTYSVLFRQHHRTLASPVVAVTGVTVLECEPRDLRSRRAPSPRRFSNSQVHQQLPAAAPAQTTGRRIGAGAGATPVSVAIIRHDTSLVRWLSLVGRSRTCPAV